ncbi:hypothetical protein [Clostridium sp. LP20]|uniref:hypothetical protein n=1 Tax=Clostridium sp. LP20 TaxID=3418665 RepID=UPI003EE7BADB
MKGCPECNSNFKFSERLRSLKRKQGEIRCNNCNSIFIEEYKQFYKTTSIISGSTGFLCFFLADGFMIW